MINIATKKKRKIRYASNLGMLVETADRREVNYQRMTRNQSRHGKCTDWIRENRRRRAAGLPQKRAEATA